MAFFSDQQVLSAAAAAAGERTDSMTEIKATASLNRMQRAVDVVDESGAAVKTFDVFLSHSSLDKIKVLGIYHLLTSRGYKVYLDSVCDPGLNRTSVTKSTAITLRRRMTQCRSLFVATSANTPSSQWVPWELGFTDGLTGKAAVLPILPAGTVSFGGLTYFELYPTVQDNPSVAKPDDLTIWDGLTRIGTWGTWISLVRRY